MKYDILLGWTVCIFKGESLSAIPPVGTEVRVAGQMYVVKALEWRPELNVELLICVERVPQ